ncbi:MAG: ATP-grasp fold amidoligase family protein [Cyclobacteriaceae bacterium]
MILKSYIRRFFIKKDSSKEKNEDKRNTMDYMPEFINHIYADILANLDRIRNYKYLKGVFLERMNYELDLESPQSYNQKIIWKKLNDRNPLLAVTADKYAVRSYIKDVLGEKQADMILIPVYHVTNNPETIPFDKLPEKYVVKPNHGSRMHLIINSKNEEDPERIIGECKKWLRTYYGIYSHEWAYKHIKKKIIIEKLLETEDHRLPDDYKFYCFHGKCKLVRVTTNRFGNKILSGFFDTDWNQIPAFVPGYAELISIEKPSNLDQMIEIAEKLSVNFDYVRVDLYNMVNEIFFGELTHYEGSGLGRLEPGSFDFELGKYWNIKKRYWIETSGSNKSIKSTML